MAIPVTAIFDIGKTNKKFFLFDDQLNEVQEDYIKFPLIADEDGYPCEDLDALTSWIGNAINAVSQSSEFELKGLNFSTYGATLVHLDENGRVVTPLYNYLKAFPEELLEAFFQQYNQEENNLATASPSLGMLNSGLQLYWLKHSKPHLFSKIRHTLHFPQYLSYLFTGKMVTEPTSIGCHTRLWNYFSKGYHSWVLNEGLDRLFPECVPTTHSFNCKINGSMVKVGVGIHDSSSALASYLLRLKDPFILISTGTWSITLNPFSNEPLTPYELERDCLNFLDINGNTVKASRFFLGYELDHQIKRLSDIFHKSYKDFKTISPDPDFMRKVALGEVENTYYPEMIHTAPLVRQVFPTNSWHPESYSSFEEAYHQVIWGLVRLQVASLKLTQGRGSVKKVYVDGGFIHNQVFVALLKHYLKDHELIFSDFPLGSAYGAAKVLEK